MNTYYYVFRVGGNIPTVRHETIESAHRESERLARIHPGQSFEILQCIGVSKTVAVETSWMPGIVPPHICEMNRLVNNRCGVCSKSF
jgi:hypothetical protein